MYRKVSDVSTAASKEDIEIENISAVQKINTEILNRDPITFWHVGCDYYGQKGLRGGCNRHRDGAKVR